jgi:glycosyltransferase involved in cell wall biosynthesis
VTARRLSVCYVVPGHDLMSTIGPSRNVLSLARALEQWADVTVAFRRVADRRPPPGVRVLELQPGGPAATVDDAAMRGVGYGEFARYLLDLRRFAAGPLRDFDIVLEKSWLLSGYLSSICLSRGQLGVPIENIVPNPEHAAAGRLLKRVRVEAGRWLAGRCLRAAPLVIAETEFLKREIAQYWGVRAERIAVVDLGVDRTLFRPHDQQDARRRFGMPLDRTVLLYVGVLDQTHDLEPVLREIGACARGDVELHLVGDGFRRADYEAMAAGSRVPVVFHGRVPHDQVPLYIAAGDLCLAPYDPRAFSSGELGYSTMKVPEYLSVGRPVASVPSGRIRSLLVDGETGFLFDNTRSHWRDFLARLPARDQLRRMGEAAGRTRLQAWEDTARQYFDLCVRQLGSMPKD